ncbi:2EXR family [Microdochium nivale]|nr:2EXR family [Microdochium nivale]
MAQSPSPRPPPPPSSFSAFPLLPAELREQIWLQALSTSLCLDGDDEGEQHGDLRLRLPRSSDQWGRNEQSPVPGPATPGEEGRRAARMTRPAIFAWVPGLLVPRRILPGDPDYLATTTAPLHQGGNDGDDSDSEDYVRHNLLLEFRHDLLDGGALGPASLALLWVCREARAVAMRSRMLEEEGAGLVRRRARCEKGYRRWDDECCREGYATRNDDDAASGEDELLADADLPSGGWRWESTLADGDGKDDATLWCFQRPPGDIDERIINTRARWFQRAELRQRPERECCTHHRHCWEHDDDDDDQQDDNSDRPVVYTRPFDPDADALLLSAYTWPLFLGEPSFRVFARDLSYRNIQMPEGSGAPRRLAVTEGFLRQLMSHGELAWLFSDGNYLMLEALWIIVNADSAVREEGAERGRQRRHGHGPGGCEWRLRPRWEVENTLMPCADGDGDGKQTLDLMAHPGFRRTTTDEVVGLGEEDDPDLVSPFSQLAHALGIGRDLVEETRLMEMVSPGFEMRLVRVVRA